MAVLDNNSDQELVRLWGVIGELSEQLSQNRGISVSLLSLAAAAKTQAVHSQTGFVLRRFNLDKTREEYENELERMNATMSAENQTLQHDNKQLNSLIKEYEQTLESVMSAFRNHARDVQEHELAIIREYESKLLARESEDAAKDLDVTTMQSASIARLSHVLRCLMRSLNGEEVPERRSSAEGDSDSELELDGDLQVATDWAMDREAELARLEIENQVLRRMLNRDYTPENSNASPSVIKLDALKFAAVPGNGRERLGGRSGTVGPFGTYKKTRAAS